MAGNLEKAKEHYKALVAIASPEKVERPIFKEVQSFLAVNK
jgi:hypothetical protein